MRPFESRCTDGGTLVLDGRVRAVFTDRTGEPPDRNFSYDAGDAADVSEARNWAAALVGARVDSQVWCEQVHGARLARAGSEQAGGPGGEPLPGTDALVCAETGIACGVVAADCAPLLLVAENAFAVVHVGWRGLVAGIVVSAARSLRNVTGADAGTFTAVVGPHIGPCCFEVGRDVADSMARVAPRSVGGETSGGRARADLGGAIRHELGAFGVRCESVGFGCTMCDRRWFSHRRGDPQRQALVVCRVERHGG